MTIMVVMMTWVDIVRRVVTPRATLAGTAFGSSQKFTCKRSVCWLKDRDVQCP